MDRLGRTPLHLACKSHYRIVPQLLIHGANATALDHTGESPLGFLMKGGGGNAWVEAALWLIGHGADPCAHRKRSQLNSMGRKMWRALHVCPEHAWAALGLSDRVAQQMELGLSPEHRNPHTGATPLETAKLFDQSEAVALLQAHSVRNRLRMLVSGTVKLTSSPT